VDNFGDVSKYPAAKLGRLWIKRWIIVENVDKNGGYPKNRCFQSKIAVQKMKENRSRICG
jgi:hypothetical protein